MQSRKSSLGISFDFGLVGCLVFGILIITYIDVDLMNFISDDDTEVTRLLSHIQNPKTTIYVEEETNLFKTKHLKNYKKCTHFDCFDIYRCGNHQQKLLVHVPEPKEFLDQNNNPIAPFTQDFVSILEAVAQSDYYTEDRNEACVFIPAIDLLNQRSLKVSID